MKKRIIVLISLLVFVLMSFNANALGTSIYQQGMVEPRYTGISSIDALLSIDASGRASISGRVHTRSGYTADVAVSLCRDSGTTVTTWHDSGSGKIEIEKTRYVTANHDYYVVVSADVYDNNGRLVDSIEEESAVVHY